MGVLVTPVLGMPNGARNSFQVPITLEHMLVRGWHIPVSHASCRQAQCILSMVHIGVGVGAAVEVILTWRLHISPTWF